MVERDYFFYFSLENSLCQDYVTEKFFNPLKRTVVPVVLGGGPINPDGSNDYTKNLGAPFSSFINAREYPNPKKLAEYLQLLANSPTKYMEFFWWKDHYSITDGQQVMENAYCDLCDKLHKYPGSKPENQYSYSDIHEWWTERSRCRSFRIEQ